MADETNGKIDYLRICGLWKNGKVFSSNNLKKRIDRENDVQLSEEEYKEKENNIRLSVMSNQWKKDTSMFSNDADAHLLLDVEKFDEFIAYLRMVKSDYDVRRKENV